LDSPITGFNEGFIMTRTTARFLASCAIAPLVFAGSQAAFAQDAAPAPAAKNNTIVVTARLVEESIQDVPVAIVAFTKEEMQRRSISELEDVALQTPGLVFEDYSNGGFGTPTIRGATQFAITGLEQNVSVFLDGVYIPRQYAFDIGSMNLERIEVVKGPQSALYGANAFAGAINYVSTTRSLTRTSASGELEVSENGGFDLSGKISAPLIPDRMSVRLALGLSKFGGDWENNHPNADLDISPGTKGKIGGYDNSTVSVGASVRPFDALTVDFDYYNFDISSETRAQYRLEQNFPGDFNCSPGGQFTNRGLQLFCGELSPVPRPGSDGVEGFLIDPRTYGMESTSEIYRVNAALQLTDQLSANYLYGRTSGDTFAAGQSQRSALVGPTIGFTFSPVGDFKYETHELRLQYEGDGGVYAMIGAFYMDGEDRDFSTGFNFPIGDLSPITSIPAGATASSSQTLTETKAIFGRISVPLMDEKLTIELEGRYTDEEKFDTDFGLPGGPKSWTYSDKYFTPRANISYAVTPDNLIYASAARGLKSGGTNSRAIIEAERFYTPDTNWTYEIGMKNTFMNGLATLNLAAFYIDWNNLQVQAAPTGGSFFSRNITFSSGGATSKGIELDGSIEVVEGLALNAGMAYIDAKYKDDTISGRVTRSALCGTATAPSPVCNFDGNIGGNDLQRTSPFQWNVGVSYDTPITDSIEFFTRLDVAGQSKQYVAEVNTATIAPRTLTNGRIGVRGDNWSLSIWGKNLFDKEYVSNAFFIATPFFSAYVPTVGNRRRVGATLSFDY